MSECACRKTKPVCYRYFKADGEYVKVYRVGRPGSVTPEYWSIANREWESSSTYDPACIGVYKVALDVALPEITEAEAFAIMHAMKYEYYQGRINGFVYRVLGDDHPEYWSGALNNWISSGANNGEVRTFESITKTQAFASIAQPNFSSCKP